MKIKELLLTPDSFFEGVTREPEDLNPPAFIIGVASLINCISVSIMLLVAGDYLILLLPIAIVWAAFLPFLTWGIFSLVMNFLSHFETGTGTLTRTLQNTGYGMLPWVVSQVFGVFTTLVVISGQTSSQQMYMPTAYGGILLFFSFLSIGFMIWTGYLWIFGIMHAQKIPRSKAIVTVTATLVLYFLVAIGPAAFMYCVMILSHR